MGSDPVYHDPGVERDFLLGGGAGEATGDFAGGTESGESVADWVSIRTEYINTRISTRDLAAKHGVSYSTLRKKAEKEGWAQARQEQGRNVSARIAQKTAEVVSDFQADRITLLMSASQKAAELLSERLDQMAADGKIKTYEIKAITEALKNVRDLYATDDNSQEEAEDDGLVSALTATAEQVCTGEDDSCMLPEEAHGEEEGG